MAPSFGFGMPSSGARPANKSGNLFHMRSSSTDAGFFRNPVSRTASDSWDDMRDANDTQSTAEDSQVGFRREDSLPLSPADGQYFDNVRPDVEMFAKQLDAANLMHVDGQVPGEKLAVSAEAIEGFTDLTARHVEDLKKEVDAVKEASDDVKRDPGYPARLAQAEADLIYWELEHQTWDLLGILMTHRLDDVAQNPVHRDVNANRYTLDAEVKAHLLYSQPMFKEVELVRSWLYKYADSPADKVLGSDGQYRGDRGWMYTKERIKSEKRLMRAGKMVPYGASFGKARNIVTELDPDAPTRQQKQLEDEDERWEYQLMKLVWAFIRKGDFEGAKELCQDAGEYWRGATLTAGEDATNPNMDPEKNNEDTKGLIRTEGNKRRELWRRMCFALARQRGIIDYERAVYGALCGDVESVTPVCQSWEDHLFAHVNSLIEGYFSAYLQDQARIPPAVQVFPAFDTMAYHSTSGGTIKGDPRIMPRIVDSLEAAPHLRPESRWPLRIIQGALISGRFEDLILKLGTQFHKLQTVDGYEPISEEDNMGVDVCDPRMLRVVVHMLLILQAVGAGFNPDQLHHDHAENVIAAYIEFLASMDSYDLVPLYASKLTSAKTIEVIGNLLTTVFDEAKRDELLKLMQLHAIDVAGCLRKTMELALRNTAPSYSDHARAGVLAASQGPFAQPQLTGDDIMLINALEWLLMGGEELRGDVLRQGTEVYRRFLLTGRLAAARVLHDKIPSQDIIPPALEDDDDAMSESEGEADPVVAAAFIEFESLVDAVAALDAWREALAGAPRTRGVDRALKKALTAPYAAVQETALEVAKGFLEKEAFAALGPSTRVVRNIYVPELVFALHHVYVEASEVLKAEALLETMQLAALVADPERGVFKCFVETGRLREYVDVIAGASRLMLGQAQEGKRDERFRIWGVLGK